MKAGGRGAGKPRAADRAEQTRLGQDARRVRNWKRWGPYLAERQWGTVREDYSPGGDVWTYFPHDDAARRAYRWGEDGLLGWTDRECRLCLALALWNGRDPILKERLFGLSGPEGNHGEDVKELYYYLDATPTYAYARALYKYPQAAFPFEALRAENARRGRGEPEFEIEDTGVFDGGRYFDVDAEFAKASPDDLLVRLTVSNRGPGAAPLHVLPTLWFRNTWIWGCRHEGCTLKPRIGLDAAGGLRTEHPTLEPFVFRAAPGPDGAVPPWLFTENESNAPALWGSPSYTTRFKDAFHERVVHGREEAVAGGGPGTKAAAWYRLEVPARSAVVLRWRLTAERERAPAPFGAAFDRVFAARRAEAGAFYASRLPASLGGAERQVARQAWAGLLWSRQFYHYAVADWLQGDSDAAAPPPARLEGRNAGWRHLFNRDVVCMPDKWEYPWYAAWDLAFHAVAFARLDPRVASGQLLLFLREWYMHPSGQLPAYEFALGDVNPPVHAWACLQVYARTAAAGSPDVAFLARAFQKLLINFTWWVNRKDPEGRNLFSGGFLGLDNIGAFDRSRGVPGGGRLAQADGTAWMAFYCTQMLAAALELARHDAVYEDVASKFFEHFVAIADAMNSFGGCGLWDERDGFYYDRVERHGETFPLRLRSMVGLVPLLAVDVLDAAALEPLAGFRKRMGWFLEHRRDLAEQIAWMTGGRAGGRFLLALPSRDRLARMLSRVFDEDEFLSPHGVRSLSRHHLRHPYLFPGGESEPVRYVPGESDTGLFGGNSNWRGPVWFPLNYLLIGALRSYHRFFGDGFTVEVPARSGRRLTLGAAADELSRRLASLFLPDAEGRRPCFGGASRYAGDPHFRDLLLFHEYFHGDTGQGLGASHQTGWTALVAELLAGGGEG